MARGGTIVWLRQDLRLADNPALMAAVDRGEPVIPVFILSNAEEGDWPPGGASRWWLRASLAALEAALRERGSRLTLRQGPALTALREIVASTGATAVHWNRRYEPDARARDAEIKRGLRADSMTAASFGGTLLCEPWELSNRSGEPYRMFTPFRQRLLAEALPDGPLPAPRRLTPPREWPASLALDELGLLPRIPWHRTMERAWEPGEAGGSKRLERFLSKPISAYQKTRDAPATDGTSGLSPHLHFGEVSVRQIWHAVSVASSAAGERSPAWRSSTFISELVWREFAHHLLYHFPQTALEPLDARFLRYPWKWGGPLLRAWQQGRTGIPIVDAGMRQLWATGSMHNRVRMIAASLLVKNLQIHWLEGARWFWDTLVDADLAANTLNWQWVAGCGADSAPFFRIFNPVLQSERFDPDGEYVRRWVPELHSLSAPHVHAPWRAPPHVLHAAGVRLADNYPQPIVDLADSRKAALELFRSSR